MTIDFIYKAKNNHFVIALIKLHYFKQRAGDVSMPARYLDLLIIILFPDQLRLF